MKNSCYNHFRQTLRRFHCQLICLLVVAVVFLVVCVFIFNYRNFRKFLHHPVCRTSPINSKRTWSTCSSLRMPAIENIENVTVFYRNQADYKDLKRCSLVDGRRIVISFASDCCEFAQILNCKSALDVGGFDMCALFGPNSIDERFRRSHIDPLLKISKRGYGFWIWKPYIILKTLLEMNDNDVLFYADSGSQFIENIDTGPICLQAQLKQEIVLFHIKHLERNWTKSDAFILLGCESKPCTDTNQILASFILLRKSFFTIQFVSTWLAYATDPRALSDLPSTLVEKEPPYFIDHRHDQSLLSLLAKKWGLAQEAFADPSQYGDATRLANPEKNKFINHRYILHTRLKL